MPSDAMAESQHGRHRSKSGACITLQPQLIALHDGTTQLLATAGYHTFVVAAGLQLGRQAHAWGRQRAPGRACPAWPHLPAGKCSRCQRLCLMALHGACVQPEHAEPALFERCRVMSTPLQDRAFSCRAPGCGRARCCPAILSQPIATCQCHSVHTSQQGNASPSRCVLLKQLEDPCAAGAYRCPTLWPHQQHWQPARDCWPPAQTPRLHRHVRAACLSSLLSSTGKVSARRQHGNGLQLQPCCQSYTASWQALLPARPPAGCARCTLQGAAE